MTLTNDLFTRTVGGDGQSVQFVYPYRYDRIEDLRVEIRDAAGVPRVPAFTVEGDTDGSGGDGATITLTGEVPAAGETVVLTRQTALLQPTNYRAGNFPSALHERAADRLTMAAQERRDYEERSLRVPVAGGPIPPILPFAPGRVLVSVEGGGFQGGPPVEGLLAPAASDAALAAQEAAASAAAAVAAVTVQASAAIAAALEAAAVLAQLSAQRTALFRSVADMRAAVTLQVGDHVQTLGYYAPGDGGGNSYDIVPAAAAVDDGGTILNLPGTGLQARGTFASGWASPRQFGARGDGNRLTGGGSNDTLAMKALFASPYNIDLGVGVYRVKEPLLNKRSARIIRGAGAAHLAHGWSEAEPAPSLILGGIPEPTARRILTRRRARSSAASPQDAPMSAVVENHGDGCIFRDFTIECFCNYANTTRLNYGSDWDIGFFNGARAGVKCENVTVGGYFRRAGFYWDVTRAFKIAELLDPAGQPLPKTPLPSSNADGCGMTDCETVGGRVGVAILGADSATHPGNGGQYYDEIEGQLRPDDRGQGGFSDFRSIGGTYRSVQHHSGYRASDPRATPLRSQDNGRDADTVGAALHIDAWAGNSFQAARGFVFMDRRYESYEPYRIRLEACHEVHFIGRTWTEIGRNVGLDLRSTNGTPLDWGDYENVTYGNCYTNPKTGNLKLDGYVGGIFDGARWIWNKDLTFIQSKEFNERTPDRGFADVASGDTIIIKPPQRGGFIDIIYGQGDGPHEGKSARLYYDTGSSPGLSVAGFKGDLFTIAPPDTFLADNVAPDGHLTGGAFKGEIRLRNRFATANRISWTIT